MNVHFSLSSSVVCSDKFIDMSTEAQVLYFHLNIYAYGRGIVGNAKTCSRVISGGIDPLVELIKNGYVSDNLDGTFRIVHWDENNGIGINSKNRGGYEYQKWRKSVLARDGRCIKCGATKNLVAHHIKPFAKYKELRLDVDNGMTLCEKCHRDIHGKRGKDV